MADVRVVEMAARQHNRFTRAQARRCGMSDEAIDVRLGSGRWVALHTAVFAISPALDDARGRWMAATLTEPGTVLSHASALSAWDVWRRHRAFETVTRPGSGGPRRLDGLLVHRSLRLQDDVTELAGIPLTTPARTLLDTAPHVSERALARCVREAVRLGLTTPAEIATVLGRHPRRRGSRRLGLVLERYSGLPLRRARSGAEVRALEVLREAARPMAELNVRIAGEEADLVWRRERRIVEIDGGPFHLDAGEDARKEAVWRGAGFEVLRLSSDAVYDEPHRLLALAPTAPTNVRGARAQHGIVDVRR